MWSEAVVPFLEKKYGRSRQIETLFARTCGLTEIEVNDLLSGFDGYDGLSVTLLARDGGVDIDFFLSPDKYSSSDTKLEQIKIRVRNLLGSALYVWGDSSLEEVVGDLLREKKLTLSVAESCTGGLISHRLTQVPGSSKYFERGLVTYSNRSKQELLGVRSKTLEQHGAVSSHVAREMAMGIRERADTDLGLSVTGIAGPEGGSDEKPMGLVYCALASIKECFCQSFNYMGARDLIKMKSALAGLNMLRQYLTQGDVK